MDHSVRRELLKRWARGVVTIGVLLAVPTLFTRLDDAFNPGRDRREMARAAEREQRANGVPFVTSSGETVRAVVYTPGPPPELRGPMQGRALVWWSRLLAAVTALGLLSGTWRTLRRPADAPPSRPVA